ncbi:MAG TPA: hypothetical protein VK666_00910 [Chryseolinea sp.]|nr:hypothetical protein [Chryseolinea sp.]
MKFLNELRRRNPVLYYFGWLNFIGALISIIMTQTSETAVLGINAWIKPMKFFFSIWIFCWTMGWYLAYLDNKRRVRIYTWMVVVVMIIEQVIITWQAANGRLSHFNITTPLYRSLFILMGVAIATLATWTGVIGYYFFRQRRFEVPMPYIWGIRLGIILFVLFSFEGGLMASRLSHTVGAPDGGPGLPVVNWSSQYGDLRVAHFIGLHSLQLIPLFGNYIARRSRSVQLFAAGYFILTALLFIQALQRVPVLF